MSPTEQRQTSPLETLARAIDPTGFDQSPAVEAWAAQRRQSAYDKARKYMASLAAVGFSFAVPPPPEGETLAVTDSSGCVWRDLNLSCETEGCLICSDGARSREQQLEDALRDLMVPIDAGVIRDVDAGRDYRDSRQAAAARDLLRRGR